MNLINWINFKNNASINDILKEEFLSNYFAQKYLYKIIDISSYIILIIIIYKLLLFLLDYQKNRQITYSSYIQLIIMFGAVYVLFDEYVTISLITLFVSHMLITKIDIKKIKSKLKSKLKFFKTTKQPQRDNLFLIKLTFFAGIIYYFVNKMKK